MNYFKNNNSLLLNDFIYWENRKLYLQLMEKFVNGRIDGRQFDREFCRMWGLDRDKHFSMEKLLDKRDDVELTKLQGFSAIISELFTDCDSFEPDSSLRDDFDISEEELRNCVKKALLEIKNRYP